MPELPEVETIAKQLNAVLPGRVIQSIEVRRDKSVKGPVVGLSGRTVATISRKAKNIIVSFKKYNEVLLIHLKMTGQLIFQESGVRSQELGGFKFTNPDRRIVGGHPTEDWVRELPGNHTRIVCYFTDGSVLYFNDMRVFGWWKIVGSDRWTEISKKLPPDVVDPEFTEEYLKRVLKSSVRPVKLVLLDQAKIGGLGNIYVNDALWLSGTKPTRKANTITKGELKDIHRACLQVILRGIETGGASESTYKHINGLGGSYQEEFLVYKRAGDVCGWKHTCGGIIEKMQLGGRGTYWCPGHQK